jgi:16S rRNA (uracil1498-N3)-methyltransferase
MAQTYRLFLPVDFPNVSFLDENVVPWVLTDKPTLHHVVTVQRLKVGQSIIAVHSVLERARLCSVASISKQALTLKPLNLISVTETPLPEITLGMALIKEARWDWVLQKATELGVRTIQPLLTEFTVVSANNISHKLERWQAICQTAALQSEGLFIPTVLPPITLTVFLNQTKAEKTVQLVALERETETVMPLKKALATADSATTAYTVAIGAEGGWSETEKQQWASLSDQWQAVSLGHRILRAETAALFMIGAIVYEQP